MVRLACIAAAAAVLLVPDIGQAAHLRAAAHQSQSQPPNGPGVSSMPNFVSPSSPGQPARADTSTPITEQSKLDIVRYIWGEYARAMTPLPADKKGFHIQAGEPPNQKLLHKAILDSGAAINTGDTVQITKIDFHRDGIAFELNGGPRGHTSWRDHIQFSMGGLSPVSTSASRTNANPVAVAPPKPGALVYLDFGHPVPNLSPDQLKHYLDGVFDFSKRSAAVNWTDTLPPKVRDAIAKKHATVGMSRREVLAALGRPDRKVREREADGTETEDWIYGYPPQKTVFVLFAGQKVIRIDQYF